MEEGAMRGDAERRALMRGPITLDHLIAADTPSGKSSYAEKALSALSPTFGRYFSSQWALSSVLST